MDGGGHTLRINLFSRANISRGWHHPLAQVVINVNLFKIGFMQYPVV
jgi:hypothetical protein